MHIINENNRNALEYKKEVFLRTKKAWVFIHNELKTISISVVLLYSFIFKQFFTMVYLLAT